MFIVSSFTMHAVWAEYPAHAWLRSAVAFNNWVFICSPDTLSRRRWQGIIFDWRLSELRASDSFLFDISFSQLYNTRNDHWQRWYLTTKMTCFPLFWLSHPLASLPACLSFLLGRWPVFALIPPLAPLLNSSQSHRWDRWEIIQILLPMWQCEHIEAWPRSGYSQFVNRRLNWDAYRLVGKNFLLSDIDWKPYEFWEADCKNTFLVRGQIFLVTCWLILSKLGVVICVQSGWEIVVPCSLPL